MKIKNWLLIALCFVMIVGLMACGQSNNEPTSPATMPSESTAPTEESTAPPTTIPVHEHVYTETITEATCTEEGKLVKTCECGEVVEEIIPVAPHDYGIVEVVSRPDCDNAIISATPNEGYTFVIWSDGNTQATRHIALSQDVSLKAYFAQEGHTIHVYQDCTVTVE